MALYRVYLETSVRGFRGRTVIVNAEDRFGAAALAESKNTGFVSVDEELVGSISIEPSPSEVF